MKRGLVALLSVHLRSEDSYKAIQSGLLGRCENDYTADERPKIDGVSSIFITRTRHRNSCQPSRLIGMKHVDKIKHNANLISRTDYYYELIKTDDDTYIKNADSVERLSFEVDAHRNVTPSLLVEQKVRLLSRGKDHPLRKRQFPNFPFPNLRVPTLPIVLPTVPSIAEIMNKSKEAVENAVNKVIDGDITTSLEAQESFIKDPTLIDDMSSRFNKLAETMKTIDTEDVERLNIPTQYVEFFNFLVLMDKKFLLDFFKSDKITAEPRLRRRLFFKVLSILPRHASFEAAKEITNNDQNEEDSVKQFAIDTMMLYFTSRTSKTIMTNEQAKDVYQFCKESFTQNRLLLAKACYLYLSRQVSKSYLEGSLSAKQIDSLQNDVIKDLVPDVSKLDATEPQRLLLAVKCVKNFRTSSGLDFVKKVLTNRSIKPLIRSDTAWGLMSFDVEPIKDDLIRILYDETEQTETRIAIFNALLGKFGKDLMPFVTRLKLNFVKNTFVDDKRLVFKIVAILKHALLKPQHMLHLDRQRNARILLDLIKEDYKKFLGFIPVEYWSKDYNDGQINYFFSMIPSTESLFPQSMYFAIGDSIDESQYSLRALHDNVLVNLFHPKSGEEPNANIQDAILKMIQELHLSLKDRVENNYIISKKQNHYETYFIYCDENNHLYPKDILAFKGNGMHVKLSTYGQSYTESGLPYYMVANHLSYTRIVPTDNGVNFLRSTGGYTASVGYSVISKSRVYGGKSVEETLRTNVHLGFGLEIPSKDEIKFNGKISLLNDGEVKTSLYYKSQRFVHAVVTDKFYTLHPEHFEPFDADKYEQVIENRGNFEITTRHPYGKKDENTFHFEDILRGFKTVGSIISRKRYSYDVKINFVPKSEHRHCNWEFSALRDEAASAVSAKLTLSHDSEKLYSVWIRRTVDSKEKTVKCELVVNDFKKPFSAYLVADVKYPLGNINKLNVKEMLLSMENATIKGALYTGNEVNTELQKNDKNTYMKFEGTFSKRRNPQDIQEYERRERSCLLRKDQQCFVYLVEQSYKYNHLELDIDIVKPYVLGESSLIEAYSMSLFEKYKSNAYFDNRLKTKGPEKARIEFDIMNELRTFPTVEVKIRSFYGESSYKKIPARISPILFGSGLWETNVVYSTKIPLFNFPLCQINSDSVTTFDGNKQFEMKNSCPKKMLAVGDCSKFQFFVIRNEDDSVTIFYNHRHNITFKEKHIYVNDKPQDFSAEPMKTYPDFIVIQRALGAGFVHRLDLPYSLKIIHANKQLSIFATPFYKNQLCGVCGNQDGDWSNDIISPKKEMIDRKKLYESWSFGDRTCA
ncbi:hypothetical protein B4U80_13212 [Leptotrombidium deliense]|uniref:Uncharacterized protein n=1 Tax=Leptotrombidium deliense TaxID=299467 RepID=A0A443SAQ8_9ACAR|nr:hypothetical protein B4U80_13212 [Leptotrombidium deliense]